jgi:hypothetical protein
MRKAAGDLKSKAGGMRRARSEAALQTRQPGALSELALAAGAGARTPVRSARVGELGLPPEELSPAPAGCLRVGGGS